MYFQNYDNAVRSGAEKMYQALDHIQEIFFALEGYHWVMLSVLSLFTLFPVVFSVAFWSSFAYARTILYIFFTSIYH